MTFPKKSSALFALLALKAVLLGYPEHVKAIGENTRYADIHLAQAQATPNVFQPPMSSHAPTVNEGNYEQAKKVLERISVGNQDAEAASRCFQINAELQQLASASKNWKVAADGLGALGAVLTATAAINDHAGGKHWDGNAKIITFAIDQAVCEASLPVCTSWMVGKTIGERIKEIKTRQVPGESGPRSVNDEVSIFLGEHLGYFWGTVTLYNLRAALRRVEIAKEIAAKRAMAVEEQARAAHQQAGMCVDKAKKDPIDEALNAINGSASDAISKQLRTTEGLGETAERAAQQGRTAIRQATKGLGNIASPGLDNMPLGTPSANLPMSSVPTTEASAQCSTIMAQINDCIAKSCGNGRQTAECRQCEAKFHSAATRNACDRPLGP